MTLAATRGLIRLSCLAAEGLGAAAQAQPAARAIEGVDVQKLANGILGIMSFTVAPDVRTSSLAINNDATASPSIAMTQVDGGFTLSKDTPQSLEGNTAYARYDPVFLASDGVESRPVPVKWNSVSATGGIGWNFPITEHLVAQPIFNFTLCHVTRDLAGAKWCRSN